MMGGELTPSKAAHRLTHILKAFSTAHDTSRFPVDVPFLAKECAGLFHWRDAITAVRAADIDGFEGALCANDDRSEWMLLYNSSITSPGRIRFTQAHELGHYLLHRMQKDQFMCGEDSVLNRSDDGESIEVQADRFAATLLMPLDDFRAQMPDWVDLNVLSAAANRYGVSLLATILRWLKHTPIEALVVVHRDDFIRWAHSSKPARKNGAFIRAAKQVVQIPEHSPAADNSVDDERAGAEVAAAAWFPHAPSGLMLREMKIASTQYDYVVTLIVLPRGSNVWGPWVQQ